MLRDLSGWSGDLRCLRSTKLVTGESEGIMRAPDGVGEALRRQGEGEALRS